MVSLRSVCLESASFLNFFISSSFTFTGITFVLGFISIVYTLHILRRQYCIPGLFLTAAP